MVHTLCFHDQAAHQLLSFNLMFLGRLTSLVMCIDCFFQLDPQVLPVLPKGFDLSQPLLLRLLKPVDLLS